MSQCPLVQIDHLTLCPPFKVHVRLKVHATHLVLLHAESYDAQEILTQVGHVFSACVLFWRLPPLLLQAAVTVSTRVYHTAITRCNCHKLTYYDALVLQWLLWINYCLMAAASMVQYRWIIMCSVFQGPYFQEFLSWSINEDCELIIKCKVLLRFAEYIC